MAETNLKSNVGKSSGIDSNNIMKFIIPSLFGIIMFLFPFSYEGGINTPVGVLSEWLVSMLEPYLPYAVTFITAISAGRN